MGCLQSYFRKGSYDVYEAHSTGLSPSASLTTGKPSTPPGGRDEHAENGSPPHPPPKNSCGEAKADPTQPPALPPKRQPRGSQTVAKEDEESNGKKEDTKGWSGKVRDEGVPSEQTDEVKTGASNSRQDSGMTISPDDVLSSTNTPLISPPIIKTESIGCQVKETSGKNISPSTAVCEGTKIPTSPEDKNLVTVEMPTTMKKEEGLKELISMKVEFSNKEESSSDLVDRSRDSSHPHAIGSPASVLISPPGDSRTATIASPNKRSSYHGDSIPDDRNGSVTNEKERVNFESTADLTSPLSDVVGLEDITKNPKDSPAKRVSHLLSAEVANMENSGKSVSFHSEKEVREVMMISSVEDQMASQEGSENTVLAVGIKGTQHIPLTSEKNIKSSSIVSGKIGAESTLDIKEKDISVLEGGRESEAREISETTEEFALFPGNGESNVPDLTSIINIEEFPTMAIDRADSQGHGASPKCEVKCTPHQAAADVQRKGRKALEQEEEVISHSCAIPMQSSLALDKCGNILVKYELPPFEEQNEPLNVEVEEKDSGTTLSPTSDSGWYHETEGKSSGFTDTSTFDAVEDMNTGKSLEISYLLSQEKNEGFLDKRTPMKAKNVTSMGEGIPSRVQDPKQSSELEERVLLVGEDVTPASRSQKKSEIPSNRLVEISLPQEGEPPANVREIPLPNDNSEQRCEDLPSLQLESDDEHHNSIKDRNLPPYPHSAEAEMVSLEPAKMIATDENPKYEAEVESIFLHTLISESVKNHETTKEVENVIEKEDAGQESGDREGWPIPPTLDSTENQVGDLPPLPEISDDGDIMSPTEELSIARSASFELVEILNLKASLEEDDEGIKEHRKGGGLVKRVLTPVNSGWPLNQEEDDNGREYPEVIGTPSVAPESKQMLGEEGAVIISKDNTSGSVSGKTEEETVQVLAEGEIAKETVSVTDAPEDRTKPEDVKEGQTPQEGAEGIKKIAVETIMRTDFEKITPAQDAVEDEKSDRADKEIDSMMQVTKDSTVTNEGPSQEAHDSTRMKSDKRGNGEEAEKIENSGEQRMKEEEIVERTELEAIGRKAVEKVLKEAIKEAERRESKKSGVGETAAMDAERADSRMSAGVDAVAIETESAESKMSEGVDSASMEAERIESRMSAGADAVAIETERVESKMSEGVDSVSIEAERAESRMSAGVDTVAIETERAESKMSAGMDAAAIETERAESKMPEVVDSVSMEAERKDSRMPAGVGTTVMDAEMSGEVSTAVAEKEQIGSRMSEKVDTTFTSTEGVGFRFTGRKDTVIAETESRMGVTNGTAEANQIEAVNGKLGIEDGPQKIEDKKDSWGDDEKAEIITVTGNNSSEFLKPAERDVLNLNSVTQLNDEQKLEILRFPANLSYNSEENYEEMLAAQEDKIAENVMIIELTSENSEGPAGIVIEGNNIDARTGEDEGAKNIAKEDGSDAAMKGAQIEAAAAVKIQSMFRGYVVRRDAAADGCRRQAEGKTEAQEERVSRGNHEQTEAAKKREEGEYNKAPSVGGGTSEEISRFSSEFHDHVVLQPVTFPEMRGERAAEELPGEIGIMDSAAAKIQAGFRGYRVRKRLRQVQNNGGTPSSDSCQSGSVTEVAATKIQAGVRGFLTRKRLKQRKAEKDNGKEKAALKIQAGFRGYQGRQKAKARKQQQASSSERNH